MTNNSGKVDFVIMAEKYVIFLRKRLIGVFQSFAQGRPSGGFWRNP
jgi:hypothetical protein